MISILSKATLGAVVTAVAASPAAFAGAYVNAENNAGWAGDTYNGATTELHIGYKGSVGENGAWYAQGGPAIVSVNGEELDTEVSGKIGGSFSLTENVSLYGEVSAITSDQEITEGLNVGTKLGATYSF